MIKNIQVSKNNKNLNLFYFIILLLSLGVFYPFVHNYVFFGSQKALVTLLALFFLTAFVFTRKSPNLILPNKSFNLIILFQVIFIFIWSFIMDSKSIRSQSFNLALSWYFVFLVINSIDVYYFIKAFIKLNIISLILCVIGLILVVIGIVDVYSIHEYGSKNIYNYLFFFIKRDELTFLNIRPSGYYDEPGSLSFIVMFLLLINRKFHKNIKWEYLLLLLPLITTSLAHIITASIFCIFYYFKIRYFKSLIKVVFVIAIVSFYYQDFVKTEYGEYFDSKTISRVINLSEGKGDEGRNGGFELGPKIFKLNPLGSSPEFIKKKYPDFVNETIWAPILYYGLFGVGVYYLIFIYLSIDILKSRNKEALFAFVLVLINLLQRPNYMSPIFLILIYYLFFIKDLKSTKTNIISI